MTDRIENLTREIDRLRKGRHAADNQMQELLLKVREIQLNLATQDKTLGKLDTAVNGNGRPGILVRVDRIEHISGGLTRAVWLLAAAVVSAAVKLIVDHLG
jgi:hypothetical protein